MNKFKQVNIRFSQVSLSQQRLRYTDYTGANYLLVSRDDKFVTVSYMFKTASGVGVPIKTIDFNVSFVVEIECEEVVE